MKLPALLSLLLAFSVTAPAAAPDVLGKLQLRVVERGTEKPLADCVVRVQVWSGIEIPELKLRTDAQGLCVVSYPTSVMRLDVGAGLEGWVPRFLTWAPERASSDEEKIPATATLRLERGATVGGKVLDEAGAPVAGVDVTVHFDGVGDASWRERARERNGWLGEIKLARTGTDGAWQSSQLPAKLADLSLSFAHTNFLADAWSLVHRGARSTGERLVVEDFQQRRAVKVLERGVRVSGTVADEAGKPVSRARVWLNVGEWANEGGEAATTDAQGRFTTGPLEPAPLVWLTVAAKGFGPERRQMAISTNPVPLAVRLEKAGVLRGKVVDAAGQPVAGVRVAVDDHQTAGWNGTTDSQGRFTWDSAPPRAPMRFYFGKPGFLQLRDVSLLAGQTEHVITLPTEPVVRGRVTDAATGKPIEKFAVIPGYGTTEHWDRSERRWGKAGEFTFRLTEARVPYFFRLEAEGYDTFESAPVAVTNGSGRLDVQLTRARATQPIASFVLTPSGQPAAGASVALCALRNYVQVSGPHLDSQEKKFATVADAAGKFSLPFEADAHTLVAVHASGFAEVPLWPKFSGQPVRLQPWAKVEGKLYLDGLPAANKDVTLVDERWSYIRGMWTTSHGTFVRRTDADGRFAFDQVPPGRRELYHVPGIGVPYQHKTLVLAEPGKTHVADVGLPKGKPQLTGRFVLSDATVKPEWRGGNASAYVWRKGPRGPRSEPNQPRSETEANRARARFYLSPEGQAELENDGSSQLEFDTTGRFVVRGLRPGTNELRFTLREPERDSRSFGRVIASHQQEIVLSTADLEQSRDLGEIQLVVKKQLKPGQLAPDFTAKTLDGGELRLADLRGKFVLLDFWATWCGPCIAEMPHLRALHEATKADDRFVFLSLSLDGDRDALAKFIAKEKPGWRQGWLGNWQETKVPDTYGVDGIPATFLIGPDGKLIAQGMRGADIGGAVQGALAGASARAKR